MSDDDLDREVQTWLAGQRRRTIITWVAALVAVAAACGLGYAVYAVNASGDSTDAQQNSRVSSAERAATSAQKTADQIASEYTTLYESFQKCIDAPDAAGCQEPPTPTPAQVKDGVVSPPIVQVETLSPEAIDAAFRRYCATNDQCDGQAPTRAELADAVATYCTANGQCRGPAAPAAKDGEDGTNGQDGASGEPGKDAPPPSDAQVLAGIAAYCEQNGQCRGPAGPTCPDGYSGQAVEVLTSLTESQQIFACLPDTSSTQ